MISIHGTGCCLADNLYTDCDFSGGAFRQALSVKEGDGGLSPGRLVFAEDFERFTGRPYKDALAEIAGALPRTRSLGGPSVVSLAHAAQVLAERAEVSFYGVGGNDELADYVESALKRLPFKTYRYLRKDFPSPRTDVLSDPNYDNGHGERTFINMIGAAGHFLPGDLTDDFFAADIVEFGGTALIPPIHENLTELLRRSREAGAITSVNLVYDFRSELSAPGKKWKLGASDDAYPHIDILIADKEEALKTSGAGSIHDAIRWFIRQGTGAVIVTDGSRDAVLAAGRGVFSPLEPVSLPVCAEVDRELAFFPERRGDTTGCGDNFAGGVISSMAEQLAAGNRGRLDLRECAVQGTVAGGFTCFIIGGAFYETFPGEKLGRMQRYMEAYREQLSAAV